MRWMRDWRSFVAGTGFGVFMAPPSAAARKKKVTGLRLNHVGMYVKDIDESHELLHEDHGLREHSRSRTRKANQNSRLSFRSIGTRSWNWRRPARINPVGFRTLASGPTI